MPVWACLGRFAQFLPVAQTEGLGKVVWEGLGRVQNRPKTGPKQVQNRPKNSSSATRMGPEGPILGPVLGPFCPILTRNPQPEGLERWSGSLEGCGVSPGNLFWACFGAVCPILTRSPKQGSRRGLEGLEGIGRGVLEDLFGTVCLPNSYPVATNRGPGVSGRVWRVGSGRPVWDRFAQFLPRSHPSSEGAWLGQDGQKAWFGPGLGLVCPILTP